MSAFFLDASALTKRYLTEIGSAWISNLTDPASANTLVVAEITRVEVAAALAARERAGSITRTERDLLVALLLNHFDVEYRILAIMPVLTAGAVELTQRHRLRGYDAVQLAGALAAAAVLPDLGRVCKLMSLPHQKAISLIWHFALESLCKHALVFVTTDDDLLAAARLEGLAVENPNQYA
jgi:hypothetical protein